MKIKTISSWFVLILISILPVPFLYFFGPNIDIFTYQNFTFFLGQSAGLVGMTMFALTFVLACKFKFIEDMFDGLDKVYNVHSILGATSFVLILFHPILLLAKYIPENTKLAAIYLLPGNYISINFGIFALFGMIILLCITFYLKIKYNYWKMSHTFLGVFFILASLHIFLVRGSVSRDFIFMGYYIYTFIVSLIGISGFIFILITKKTRPNRLMYKIDKLKLKNGIITDIIMTPMHKSLKYNSGQFVFLKFHNKYVGKEPHPFSIASKSNDSNIRVVIKNLGDFTSKLDKLNEGDKVEIEGPYGRFNYKKTEKDKIWVAAGIGITPFIGMAQEVKSYGNSIIYMFYCVRNEKELVSQDIFEKAKNENNKFHLITWFTDKQGYLTAENILEIVGKKNLKEKELFLCGPKGFKESIKLGLIKQGLKDNGLLNKNIHDEDFNFKWA